MSSFKGHSERMPNVISQLMDCVLMPIRHTDDYLWVTEREAAFFQKKLNAAKRREKKLKKAGFTLTIEGEYTFGGIVHSRHFWRNQPALDCFCDAILDGLRAGRIKL
jgi:hypothetical protein